MNNPTSAATTEEVPAASVNTTLGLISGEILLSLETCGPISAAGLVDKLEWPPQLVYMAVGSLIRRRRIGAAFRQGEVVIHLWKRDESRNEAAL